MGQGGQERYERDAHRAPVAGVTEYIMVMVFVAVCVTSAFAQAMEAQPHESLENLACGNCHLGVTGGNPFHDAIPNLLDAGQRYQPGFLSTIGLEAHGRRRRRIDLWVMPAFPLSEGERHALKAYLATLQNAPKSSGVSAFLKPLQIGDKTAIERGRMLTTQSMTVSDVM